MLLAALPWLLSSAGTAHAQEPDVEDARPNILLIVVDDMGSSDIGPYGGEIATPNLDSLADEGVTFTNFHTSASCSPTRSMLLSGVDNHLNGFGTMTGRLSRPPAAPQVGQPGYEGYLNDRVVTIASLLQEGGYHTYLTGKWHMGNEDGYRPAQRGFEESYALIGGGFFHYWWEEALKLPPGEDTTFDFRENDVPVAAWPDDFYSSKNYTDKMIEYIDKHHGDGQPFFGFVSYTAPHSPLHAPDEYIAKYADRYTEGWDELRRERFARQKAMGLISADSELPPMRGEGFVPWDSVSAEQQAIDAKKMAVYAAMIDYTDMSIGRLLQHLKEIGEYDNTLVIFMSDNGPEANNLAGQVEPLLLQAGLALDNSLENIGRASSYVSPAEGFGQATGVASFGAKSTVTEGGTRNNLIVSYPGVIEGGRYSSALATVLDIVPTLLSYAEVRYPSSFNDQILHQLDGSSMRLLLEGDATRIHSAGEPIGMEVFGSVNKALFQGDWKLLCVGDAPLGAGKEESWKLFNLAFDPNEQIDLAAYYPARLNRMVNLYQKYQERVGYVSATTGVDNCALPGATGE